MKPMQSRAYPDGAERVRDDTGRVVGPIFARRQRAPFAINTARQQTVLSDGPDDAVRIFADRFDGCERQTGLGAFQTNGAAPVATPPVAICSDSNTSFAVLCETEHFLVRRRNGLKSRIAVTKDAAKRCANPNGSFVVLEDTSCGGARPTRLKFAQILCVSGFIN